MSCCMEAVGHCQVLKAHSDPLVWSLKECYVPNCKKSMHSGCFLAKYQTTTEQMEKRSKDGGEQARYYCPDHTLQNDYRLGRENNPADLKPNAIYKGKGSSMTR